MTPITRELTRALYDAMIKKRWTQVDVAKNADVPAKYVSDLFWGHEPPPNERNLERVAAALGVPLDKDR